MFEGLLEDDLSVYATTAANGHESSWGGWGAGWLVPCRGPAFICLAGAFLCVCACVCIRCRCLVGVEVPTC